MCAFVPLGWLRNADASGWQRRDLEGTHSRNLDAWLLAHNGKTLLYKTSSATRPPQWFAARLDGTRITDERQLTDLNPSFANKPTGKVEVVRWTGALDEEVEGLLHYPLDWREGEKRPLILDIHGGPNRHRSRRMGFPLRGPQPAVAPTRRFRPPDQLPR